jgi:hypothetical protein
LTAEAVSPYAVALEWNPVVAGDLAGYRVYRDDVEVGDSVAPSFVDSDLTPLTTYEFKVAAYDTGDNASDASDPAPATTPQDAPQYEDDLVAAYGFEEGAGAAVFDQSIYGNHGVIEGNGPPAWAMGKFGGALECDGTSDRVVVEHDASLALTNQMTLMAWVYPTATPTGWEHVIAKHQNDTLAYYLAANSSFDHARSGFNVGGTFYSTGGGDRLPVNAWSHIASTYNGSVLRVYVNGAQVATLTVSLTLQSSEQPLYLGSNVFNEYYRGRIDEVRIYRRVLDLGEIQTLMAVPATGWKLASPDSVTDVSAWVLYP